jgi:hypothetical protein
MKVCEQVTAALRHYDIQTMCGLMGEETHTSRRRSPSLGDFSSGARVRRAYGDALSGSAENSGAGRGPAA